MCKKLDFRSPTSPSEEKCFGGVRKENGSTKSDETLNGEENYTEEHVQVIKQIKGKNDYDAVLGVETSCSVDEIRRAYRKLSLKVHPDKNKALDLEDAFKKVSKAFKCLSDDDSRRLYYRTGFVEEFGYKQWHNVRRGSRRTTTTQEFFQR